MVAIGSGAGLFTVASLITKYFCEYLHSKRHLIITRRDKTMNINAGGAESQTEKLIHTDLL